MAAACAQQAIAKDASVGEAYAIAGAIALERGNLPEAIKFLGQGKKYNAKNPLYHYQCGLLYATVGDEANAKANFLEAISLYPDFKLAWYGLIAACVQAGGDELAASITEGFARRFEKEKK